MMKSKSRLSAAATAVALLTFAVSLTAAQSTEAPSPALVAANAATTATAPLATAGGSAATMVTWSEFSGYKRYHGNCIACHGQDATGGSFAPNLTESVKRIDHDGFLEVVVNGKTNAQLAMPAFGEDPNVMCFIEDIYAYLKARSEGRFGRGRPEVAPKKPAEIAEDEAACLGA